MGVAKQLTISNDKKNRRLILSGVICLLAALSIAIWEVATRDQVEIPLETTLETITDLGVRSARDEAPQTAAVVEESELLRSARTELEPEAEVGSTGPDPITVPVTIQVHALPLDPIAGAKVLVRVNSETFSGSTNSEGKVTLQMPLTGAMMEIETAALGFFHGRHRRKQTGFIRTPAYREVLVSGRVLDEETQEPVQATIRYFHDRCERVCFAEELLSEADESFEFSATSTVENAGFWVTAPGYAGIRARGPQENEAGYEILLPRGFEMRGKVVDITTDSPVAGAQVTSSNGMRVETNELGEFNGRFRLDTEDQPHRPASVGLSGSTPAVKSSKPKPLTRTIHQRQKRESRLGE